MFVIVTLFCCFIFSPAGLSLAAEKTAVISEPKQKTDKGLKELAEKLRGVETVTVTGRLYAQDKTRLVLHANDARLYTIKGALTAELQQLLEALGKDNLVSLEGKTDGKGKLICERKSDYVYNQEGKKELRVDTRCLRYHNLEVTRIVSSKISSEPLPEPERDSGEEKLMQEEKSREIKPAIGQFSGKISAVNVKSPIKTLEIVNSDQDSPMKKLSLIITINTTIAKNIAKPGQKEQIIALTDRSLKPGQQVNVMYSRDKFKTEAMLITIVKE